MNRLRNRPNPQKPSHTFFAIIALVFLQKNEAFSSIFDKSDLAVVPIETERQTKIGFFFKHSVLLEFYALDA